jgi:diguanylate cyclase (GGDEF)-like protein
MVRKTKVSKPSNYTILLVDDSSDYLAAVRPLLEREGHKILVSNNGREALEILKIQKVDLMLLDYYMPGMTGEEVVTQLRQFNSIVQVILQTGYSSEQPPRELLRRLDIQGYYDKSEGPEKLLLWTDVGLKAAYTVQLLSKSRQGLQYILDVTPDMHKIQSLTDLLQGILWQVAGLLGVVNSFLAVLDDGGLRNGQSEQAESFLAMIDEDTDLIIRACTGHFVSYTKVSDVIDEEGVRIIQETLRQGAIKLLPDITVVPLRVGELTIGLIYLDRQVVLPQDKELLNVFANQVAVAIQNSQLYEMATIDHLTGLYVRSFFEKWLHRELRTAFRSQQSLCVLMMDLDKFKHINDVAGHLGGDQALAIVGKVLKQATRGTDVVGRYGGDEFAIILPQTNAEGVQAVGQRIIKFLAERNVTTPEGELLALHGSLGFCIIEPHSLKPENIPHPIPPDYFENMGLLALKQADEALYESKKKGGDQIKEGSIVTWKEFK